MTISKNKTGIALATSLLPLLLSPAVKAEQNHVAHQHGVARLTMVSSDEGLEIALESPAENLFGFEYRPSDNAEKAKVNEIVEALKEGSALFRITEAAGCELSDTELESDFIDEHSDADGKTEARNNKEHTGKHEMHQSENTHNDIEAIWIFSCTNPAEIKRVETQLFAAFPEGFQQLNVDWLSPTQSGHLELEGDGAILLTQ